MSSRVSISRAALDLVLKSFRMDAKGTKFSFRGEFADEIEADVREIPGGLSPLTPCQGHAAQQGREEGCGTKELLEALRFYAEGHHFAMHDPCNWDTVSGEPQNFLEDAGNTATVEDGSIAKAAIARAEAALEEPGEEGGGMIGRYRHNKTGNLYFLASIGIDCTNCRDGESVAIYYRYGRPHEIYVRDLAEFQDKFTPATEQQGGAV